MKELLYYAKNKIYEQQQNAYKMKKYTHKLNQYGGGLKINYNKIFNVVESMYDALYAYVHLYMGTLLDSDPDNICPLNFKYSECNVIDIKYFNVSSICINPSNIVSTRSFVEAYFVDDKIHNNLVVCFSTGNYTSIDKFDIDMTTQLMEIYNYLGQIIMNKSNNPYKNINFVGHSQGMSAAILLSYFIMIIENPNYDIKNSNILATRDDYIRNIKHKTHNVYTSIEEEETQQILELDKNNSVLKTFELLSNARSNHFNLSKLICICGGAGQPVLFTDKHKFYQYVNYYDNRYIHFVNEMNGIYDAWIYNNYNYNISNFIFTNINTFEKFDISNEKIYVIALSGNCNDKKNIDKNTNLYQYLDLVCKGINLHDYKYYRNKLKYLFTFEQTE